MKTHLLSTLFGLGFLLSACADNSNPDPMPNQTSPNKDTIILVHGAFADHHAFDGVKPLLEEKGYRVLAPDLPGHGDDATPAKEITLDTYVSSIVGLLDAQPDGAILVGHSMAGMVVAQAAERLPARVKKLLFIAAYLPQNGQNLQQLAETDKGSLVGANLQFAPDYTTVTIRSERVAEAICADVPPEVQAIIVASQKPEPVAPFQGTVTLTAESFGRVPKAYVSTSEDRAVTPELQQRMLAGYPEMSIASIPTSHLPFVARPAELVDKMLSLVTPQ